jgi:hypothetical protein
VADAQESAARAQMFEARTVALIRGSAGFAVNEFNGSALCFQNSLKL